MPNKLPDRSSDKANSKNNAKSGDKSNAKAELKPAKIPYEPGSRGKKQKTEKKTAPPAQTSMRSAIGIPPEVNKRIVRRMAIFCGIPTSLGFLTIIASYIAVSRHLVELPNSVVVLVSMLLLGIGVLGLSYGAISASWDEGKPGSWWGWGEFSQNFGYLTAAWKSKSTEQNKPAE